MSWVNQRVSFIRICTKQLQSFKLLRFCFSCQSQLQVDKEQSSAFVIGQHNHSPPDEPARPYNMVLGKALIDNDLFIEYFTNAIQFSGEDVTNEVEFLTNNKGFVSAFLQSERFIKSNENNGVVHYRCVFYKEKCKARLAVDASTPLVKLKHSHNHKPVDEASKIAHRNVVSVQRFRRNSSNGSSYTEVVQIKP